jgi:O-antigen/teichoic acid export membrane protein
MSAGPGKPATALARRYILVSWLSHALTVAFGLLIPSFLLPGEYGAFFQLRQIHLLGVFAFAFVLHGAVLELSLSRGRGDAAREAAIRRTSLHSVLVFSGVTAAGGAAVAALAGPYLAPETRIGIAAFALALPAIAVTSWCNRILLTAQRLDRLWNLVLVQAPVVAAATLGGAFAFDFGGALAGVLLGNLVAALYALWLCRGTGFLHMRRDRRTLRTLVAVGAPQSLLGLAGVSFRVLDRNFAYLAYGEDLGGAFALAATFSLSLMFLTQVIPDAARPLINQECGRYGSDAPATRFRAQSLGVFGLTLAAAGVAYFFLQPVYQVIFPRYLQRYPLGVDLARACLFAACPLALAYFAQLYLVATTRPAIYLAAPISAVLLAVAGNAVAVAMDWGLFGIVGATGCAYLLFTVVSMAQASLRYPALRRECARCGWQALALSASAALLVVLLEIAGGRVAQWLGIAAPWETVPGGAAFALLAAFVLHRKDWVVHD